MGLFDFGKKEKKKKVKKKEPSKIKEESFEMGSNGLIFNARMQILGTPKDHVKETAKQKFEEIKNSLDEKHKKRYYVLHFNISEPQKQNQDENEVQQKNTDLFFVDIDVDIGVKNKHDIFNFCLQFMPYLIEITEPMNVVFSASDLNHYLTDLQGILHQIGFDLKNVNAINAILNNENKIFRENMRRLFRNNIILSLKQKNKDIKEISKNVGVPEDQLRPFIDNMIKDNEIKLIKNKYSIVK